MKTRAIVMKVKLNTHRQPSGGQVNYKQHKQTHRQTRFYSQQIVCKFLELFQSF